MDIEASQSLTHPALAASSAKLESLTFLVRELLQMLQARLDDP
jgi:hypothetical protein